jgi:hypothetical protein
MAFARADIIFARCKRGEKIFLVRNQVEGIDGEYKGRKGGGGGKLDGSYITPYRFMKFLLFFPGMKSWKCLHEITDVCPQTIEQGFIHFLIVVCIPEGVGLSVQT